MWGELSIADYRFSVEKATLRGQVLSDQFSWGLDIWAAEREIDGMMVGPYAYTLDTPGLRNVPVKHWYDILGKRLTWDESYDQKTETTQASLYFYTHEDINRSTLEFFMEDGKLYVKWKGEAEISAETFDDYDRIIFEVQTEVHFEGFVTIDIAEADALNQLRRWVTGDKFGPPVSLPNKTFLFPVVDNCHAGNCR